MMIFRNKVAAKETTYSMIIETDQKNWDTYFKYADFPNLLQSWNYGKAKEESNGWIVQHGVILKNKSPIALCQWLEKSLLKLGRIIRVNRGPILLNHQSISEEKLFVYRFIKDYFSIAKRNFLFIAPGLENNIENNGLLKNLGYRRRNKFIPWKSALIDLKKTEQELRSSLRSRLRNYLNRTESANYQFESSTKKTDFASLIKRYIQLQEEKKFVGIKVDCVKSLYNLDNQNGSVFINRAKNENGELMAEIFLVMHGNQCTYLISWTSPKGTKSYAMHFLMWKTMLDLKARGVSYFDVGGYSEEEHSSVCQFKKGFGGKEYCLVGEYRGFF